MNYIKIFQNAHDLSISVGTYYSEYQLMHTFMDHFHQRGRYSAQIASQQAELRREMFYQSRIIEHLILTDLLFKSG